MAVHSNNKKTAGASGGVEQLKPSEFYKNGGAWQRVSKTQLCPICGRFDWCSVSPDGAVAICMRVTAGAVKPTKNGGFLHRLNNSGGFTTGRAGGRSIIIPFSSPSRHDLPELAKKNETAVKPARLQRLAETLGVTVPSLRRLGIGWDAERCAWSFPMTDADGKVVGIRLRLDSGKKFAVTGGKEGLFTPTGLAAGVELFVTEGPTDCAALLDLGLTAVGRPSCTGGVHLLVALAKKLTPSRLVVVADGDEPGKRGAAALASKLRLYCPDVRVIAPPHGVKDARAWKMSGATAADVLADVHVRQPVVLPVKGYMGGKAVMRHGR